MKLKNKRILFAGGTIALILIVAFIWLRAKPDSAQQATDRIVKVSRGTVRPNLTTTGEILSANEVKITPEVSGTLKELNVAVGDRVTKNQTLAKIDATQAQQQFDSAYSNLVSAKLKKSQIRSGDQGAIDQTQQSVDSAARLLQSAQTSLNDLQDHYPVPTSEQQQQLDAAQDAVDKADDTYQSSLLALSSKQQSYNYDSQIQDEQVNQAQLSVNSAQESLDNATITSPIDGQIIAITAAIGDQVGSSSQGSQSGSSGGSSSAAVTSSSSGYLFWIADLSKIQVKTTIDQADIPKLAVGQKAKITLDALPDKSFTGSVTSIDPAAQTSNNVTTYNAYISLDTTDSAIKLGMSANVKINLGKKDNVLIVPNIAVRSGNSGKIVRKVIDGQPTAAKVLTGLSDDENTEITSGLSAGDSISLAVFSTQSGSNSSIQRSGGNPFGGRGGGAARRFSGGRPPGD